jgi:hypothetical protein
LIIIPHILSAMQALIFVNSASAVTKCNITKRSFLSQEEIYDYFTLLFVKECVQIVTIHFNKTKIYYTEAV